VEIWKKDYGKFIETRDCSSCDISSIVLKDVNDTLAVRMSRDENIKVVVDKNVEGSFKVEGEFNNSKCNSIIGTP